MTMLNFGTFGTFRTFRTARTALASLTLVAFATLGVACNGDDTGASESATNSTTDDNTTTEAQTTSETEDPTTTDDPTTTTDDPTTTTDDPTTTTDDPTTTTDDTTTDETTTTDGTTDGTTGDVDPLCAPEDDDEPCATCGKENCCDELVACSEDEDCVCWLVCLGSGGNEASCFQECGANANFLSFGNCVQMSCQGVCF